MLNTAMNLVRNMMEGKVIYSIIIEGTNTLLVKELTSFDYKGSYRVRFNFNNEEIEAKLYNEAEVVDSYNLNSIEDCMSFLGEFISMVK